MHGRDVWLEFSKRAHVRVCPGADLLGQVLDPLCLQVIGPVWRDHGEAVVPDHPERIAWVPLPRGRISQWTVSDRQEVEGASGGLDALAHMTWILQVARTIDRPVVSTQPVQIIGVSFAWP